jgi:hypothetical protein
MAAKLKRLFWEEAIREFLKKELARKMGYKELAKRFPGETRSSITNKLFRGSFKASFFVIALDILGVETLDVKAIAVRARRIEKLENASARSKRRPGRPNGFNNQQQGGFCRG